MALTAELIRRACEPGPTGDSARDAIVRDLGPRLTAQVESSTRGIIQSDADDIVQDALIKIFTSLAEGNKFDSAARDVVEGFRRWTRTVAKSVAADHARVRIADASRSSRVVRRSEDCVTPVSKGLRDAETRSAIRNAMRELSSSRGEAVRRSVAEDATAEQVSAAQAKTTPQVVRQRVHRAKDVLARALRTQEPEQPRSRGSS